MSVLRILIVGALMGLFAMRAGADQAAPSVPSVTSENIVVVAGKSRFVDLKTDIETVVVGDPAKADVVWVAPRRIYILGKSLGTTNVQLLDPEENVRVILDLVVSADISEAQVAVNAALPGNAVHIHSVNGRLRLAGWVKDDQTAARVLEVAQTFSEQPVINTLRIRDPKQVFLQVQIIEASRAVGQELGVDLSELKFALSGVTGTSQAFAGTISANAAATISIMVNRGLARFLATPTLTALSGETASFLAGGEVPIPASVDENPTIVYKEFGVRLNFTPTVQEDGLINLKLEPEVSQIDPNNSYSSNNVQVPAFATRRASTTVELRSGQSFAIAGLIQSAELRNTQGLPGLSSLPLLGPMFRHATLNDKETELLIIVTPSLTRPVAANTRIATPLTGRRASRGAEFFVDGRLDRSDYTLGDALRGKGISGAFGPILSIGGNGAFHAR